LTNYKSDDLIGVETEEFAKRLFIDEETSLTDKWRAAMMANYTMGIKWDDYNKTSTSLNEMYNSSTFVLTFTQRFRNMIEIYLFNNSRDISQGESIDRIQYLEGFENKRLAKIFNNTDDFFNGMEIDIQTYTTPMFAQMSPIRTMN
jgi:hypothetical protein